MIGATYRFSANQTLEVTQSGAELLEVESTWAGGGELPPAHLHPAQDEHFEVVEGRLRVLLDGEIRELGPGDVLDIPRGSVHAMTAVEDGARAIWQTRPALRTEEFYARMDLAVGRGGSLLAYAPVFRAHTAEVRLMKPPPVLQAPLFAILAFAGRLRR